MSDYIIKVENLGKKYRIQHQGERERYVALRDVLANKATAPLRWLRARSAKGKAQSVSLNGNGSSPLPLSASHSGPDPLPLALSPLPHARSSLLPANGHLPDVHGSLLTVNALWP